MISSHCKPLLHVQQPHLVPCLHKLFTTCGGEAHRQSLLAGGESQTQREERLRGGVYTVLVWGNLYGEDIVISEYSVFQGVTPPVSYALG